MKFRGSNKAKFMMESHVQTTVFTVVVLNILTGNGMTHQKYIFLATLINKLHIIFNRIQRKLNCLHCSYQIINMKNDLHNRCTPPHSSSIVLCHHFSNLTNSCLIITSLNLSHQFGGVVPPFFKPHNFLLDCYVSQPEEGHFVTHVFFSSCQRNVFKCKGAVSPSRCRIVD